jgi:hypothetical protein
VWWWWRREALKCLWVPPLLLPPLSHYSVSLAAAKDTNPFCHDTLFVSSSNNNNNLLHLSFLLPTHPIRYLLLLPLSVPTTVDTMLKCGR